MKAVNVLLVSFCKRKWCGTLSSETCLHCKKKKKLSELKGQNPLKWYLEKIKKVERT